MIAKRRAHHKIKHQPPILNDDKVCEYLFQHPDFFIRHAQQIDKLRIPHPVRGVVSLPEWQMTRQRNKIKQLENEIQSLVQHATINERLFSQLMTLQLALLKANSFSELLEHLNDWGRSLGLLGAYLYLFEDKWQLTAPSNFQHLSLSTEKFDFIRIRHLQYGFQYLGQLSPAELTLLIPEQGYVGSIALSLLGDFGDLGVLVFASRDPHHYQPGQGTVLLEKLGQILPVLINRWIERKPLC
ncbi:DUF484 family protein [Utexia brackfieldae]|uniref:DUF484 family protein n=1 Tax=Utexia brackfieldae TaxID=3074108 RepID=UPI00370DA54C